jgi:serine/threonine protein kinase
VAVKHIPCGPPVNQSEKDAFEYLRSRLQGLANTDWYLLTNVVHSAQSSQTADEIDIVCVGSSGVHVVEVKHWDSAFLRRNPGNVVEGEADRLERKARRLKGTLHLQFQFEGFVSGKLLLTKVPSERHKTGAQRKTIKSTPVFGLVEWADLLETDATVQLSNEAAFAIAKYLEPRFKDPCGHKVRNFGDFVEMEMYAGVGDGFHRVYRARRRPGRERVIVHMYDLSALDDKNALEVARREFDALQRYQKSPFLPNLMDSFQEAALYPGEICFFSYTDTDAADLASRCEDPGWLIPERIRFARRCVEALLTLHEPGSDTPPALHRNLTPKTIRVRSNGEPLLTGLHAARISGSQSVGASLPPIPNDARPYVAPEVLKSGWPASTTASDVYSLCSSLHPIFSAYEGDSLARRAREVLGRGLAIDPAERPLLRRLLEELGSEQTARPRDQPIPTEYWDADTTQEFRGRHYRVVTRLGRGGTGSTFKVVEVSPSGQEEVSGPYVAKSITTRERGQEATTAYARVRAHTGGPHLAGVLEVAREWTENQVSALLRWVEGEPLSDWIGVLPLYFEEVGDREPEAMALGWLRDMCQGLSPLHQAGLIHGDVSPRNIIVKGPDITLTDYDLVVGVGEPSRGGTPDYMARQPGEPAALSDDIFALGGTLFHALFGRTPFLHGASLDKSRGLAWVEQDRRTWPCLAAFLDKATHSDARQRFVSAADAVAFLDARASVASARPDHVPVPLATATWSPQRVEWVRLLQQCFPGSPKGNVETRGLDSEFAIGTYVETAFDRQLADDITGGRLSLVVLCGNAGDGKTALLQNLARRLGVDPGPSARRLWDFVLSTGTRIRANLDGSAAFQGRTAASLLDEFFGPFMEAPFPAAAVHLVAINDGPLVAWLNNANDSYLKSLLLSALRLGPSVPQDPRVLFVDLNARSLVGGLTPDGELSHGFLQELLDKMLGPTKNTWAVCETCTAQQRCHIRQSVQALHHVELGPRIRVRLTEVLRAIHQRGDVHITARGLKAALAYVFFGTDDCDDLHANPGLAPAAYFDRLFDVLAPHRHGELLRELCLLDPALESHPRIDAELLRSGEVVGSLGASESRLSSLRRRAFFEWAPSRTLEVAGASGALLLARGRHLPVFMRAATGSQSERQTICSDLCDGLSRLEDLPALARSQGYVPLKVQGRTPTETAFWVGKPKNQFSLDADLPDIVAGLERLHTRVVLSYRYQDGRSEKLLISAELFHLLMELKDGYQLSDARSDEIFAHLSIFQQRLAQEDDSQLFASSPLDERVFRIYRRLEDGVNTMVIEPDATEPR